MSTKSDYIKLIQTEASAANIDTDLFTAICEVESSWDKDAYRYEKDFDFFEKVVKFAALNKISTELETELQRTSFGLCQIMGSNLRVSGYDKFLSRAFDPEVNIKYGVIFFKKRCDIHIHIKDKIASWNWGSPAMKDGVYLNEDYVSRVYACYEKRILDKSSGLS